MNIHGRHKTFLSLESISFTDIVMNMFIFFFVSFSLLYTFNPQQESKIKVNLPKGATDVRERDSSKLVVSITSRNEIYIGNNKISREALATELPRYFREAKSTGIVLKADKQASVDYFVKVLDTATRAGIDKLGVAIELQRGE